MSATAVLAGGQLRYSAVWEDHALLEGALRVHEGTTLLMIASAGCNVLNLLRLAPRRIVALDVNPAQTALLELKLAALRTLSHDELLRLIGVTDADDRLALYERARVRLSERARGWWDANLDVLDRGAERAGRLDRFFAEFRREQLATPERLDAVTRLLDSRTPTEQTERARALFTPEFEAAFRAHFTREKLGVEGRDPALFDQVGDADVPGWFLSRLRWACNALPTRGNFYLERFLLGAPRSSEQGPPYLKRANFARLRSLAHRVDVVTEPLDAYLADRPRASLDGAALSNVFEYLAADDADALFADLARTVTVGGRIAYWNLLVRRRGPSTVGNLTRLDNLSRALWQRDRAWFYQSFNVDEVTA